MVDVDKQPSHDESDRRQRVLPVDVERRDPSSATRRVHDLPVVHERRGGRYISRDIRPAHGNDPATIKQAIHQADGSYESIAAIAGRSASTVRGVVHGFTRSDRIEIAIAEVTGRSLAELFPNWYPAPESRDGAQ